MSHANYALPAGTTAEDIDEAFGDGNDYCDICSAELYLANDSAYRCKRCEPDAFYFEREGDR